jgi:hypothetical protein
MSLVFLDSCSSLSGDNEVRRILADVDELQKEEEAAAKELMSRENIWLGDRLDEFPENRSLLVPIAKQQIDTISRMVDLEEKQIEKLRSVPSVTADSDFLIYADLQTQIFEKRLQSNKLALRRFGFISDPNITNRKELENKLAELRASQQQIDTDLEKLAQKMAEHRKRIGK